MAMAAPAFHLFFILALAGAVALLLSGSMAPAGAVAGAVRDPQSVVVVKLQGHASVDDKTSVGVQKHELSFPGFINGSGDWQAFPGHEHLFTVSTTLPFGNSYDDLIGGLANLPDVPLGRDAMQQAARVLSAHNPSTTTDFEPLKRALASLKVMISDAQKLQPIYETVNKGWLTGARVSPQHLPYIEHWDTMSYEILRSKRTGSKWEDGPFIQMLERSANIRSREEALAVTKALMNADFEQVLMAHATKIKLDD